MELNCSYVFFSPLELSLPEQHTIWLHNGYITNLRFLYKVNILNAISFWDAPCGNGLQLLRNLIRNSKLSNHLWNVFLFQNNWSIPLMNSPLCMQKKKTIYLRKFVIFHQMIKKTLGIEYFIVRPNTQKGLKAVSRTPPSYTLLQHRHRRQHTHMYSATWSTKPSRALEDGLMEDVLGCRVDIHASRQ